MDVLLQGVGYAIGIIAFLGVGAGATKKVSRK